MSKIKKIVKKAVSVVKKVAPYVATAAAMYYGGSALIGAAGTSTAVSGAAAASGGLSWGSIASGGLTALQGYQGYQESKQAAEDLRAMGREQEAIDLENQIREHEETIESAQRTREQQVQTEGQASIGAGASGFAGGSSLDRYMSSMKSTHEGDIEWMLTSGAAREDIMARESAARAAATAAQAKAASSGAWSSVISAGSSLVKQGADYGWLK